MCPPSLAGWLAMLGNEVRALRKIAVGLQGWLVDRLSSDVVAVVAS